MARLPGQLVALFLLLTAAAWGLTLASGNNSSFGSIQEFVDAHGDPCSLPVGGIGTSTVDWALPYMDISSLVNDIDLAIVGLPTRSKAEAVRDGTDVGGMLTTIRVDDVLKGSATTPTIDADLVGRISLRDGRLVHIANVDLDSCSSERLLLFLKHTPRPDVYELATYQGWASVDGDSVRAGELNHLFDRYANAATLVQSVRRMALEQESIPKGRLLCQSRQQRDEGLFPVACPGDVFNPYESFHLAKPATEAFVVVSDPGPSPLTLSRSDLAPESPQLAMLLESLNAEVSLQPLAVEPEDMIRISLYIPEAAQDNASPTFQYSPSTHMIRMSSSNGQFDAPPAFVEAMAPFVAQQQETANQ